MPLEGDSEEPGDYMGGDPHEGVSGESHKLGAPSSGVLCRGDELPGLAGVMVGLTGVKWEAWTLLMKTARAGLPAFP